MMDNDGLDKQGLNKNSSDKLSLDKQKPWQAFRRPFVRDLAFALASPNAFTQWVSPNPLVVSPQIAMHDSDFWQTQFDQYLPRLRELDTGTQYQQLTRYLMRRPSPYRLGFHFEGLMHFWLEDGYQLGVHPYEVLAHNVQLYQGKQTTGELDFILRNHATGEVEHWELAVKFYLGSAPYAFANWVGINSRDNLERKLMHMQSKQFRTVWVDLDGYNQVKIDKRYVVMKGRFFVPLEVSADLALDLTLDLSAPSSFVRPDWLTKDFPIHHWVKIGSEDEWQRLLRILTTHTLRPAHYIEWFTHRGCYDELYDGSYEVADGQVSKQPLNGHSVRFEDLQTSLYMSDGEHLVVVK